MKVLLGLGNPLGRDDALGLRLAERFHAPGWLALPAQSVENALGLVEKIAPELLVIVDAAEMGLPPGSIRRLPLQWGQTMVGSTHGLPLGLLLALSGLKNVVLIGVEPKDRGLGEGVSPEVEEALENLAQILRQGQIHQIPKLIPNEEEEI